MDASLFFGGKAVTADAPSGVETRLVGVGATYDLTGGPIADEEHERLRKKFRGRQPKDILDEINADTHYGKEHGLRRRVLDLLNTNLQSLRRDPAGFFRDEAGDIARMLREPDLYSTFMRSLLWDLYVILHI